MLCNRCRKNVAVVFVTKMENGRQTQEGLCMSCAKELNIGPLPDLKQMGISEEEFDRMNRELMENPEMAQEMMGDAMSMVHSMLGSQDEDEEEEAPAPEVKTKTKEKKKRKLIEQYGVNLTEKARAGQIDRVIGRKVEIERVIQILNRRNKNNPCIIGEPGVGKTAIAEGLAVRIAEGQVPHKMLDKEIYLLDLAGLVAGTQFRGQFESRIKGIIKEAVAAGNIIFVIDEVHNIVAAGDAEGAMGAANILKPALAKGQIQVIGATTLEEYRKYIEKDAALERRFQPVMVDEPSIADSIEILKGIRDYYEKYHCVKISDEIIEKAVKLSERYISDRFLPDKAIDVIDEAGSRVNLKNDSLIRLEQMKKELEAIRADKEDAVSSDSTDAYQRAAELKVRECRLEKEIEIFEKLSGSIALTEEDIAEVIEMWTKIPVKSICEAESKKLLKLEEHLHERLIGQNDAVSAVARAIRIHRSGIGGGKRPVSFIFVGPTGVGKTELVKQIAKQIFDDEDAMIRLDMSEFMEKHTVSKLIGSPPGYVGYDDAGQLTEKVRRHPYSVILMDEIEKAHPDIFNMLLQILDEGKLTDSHGKTVHFENTIIVMTSNAGSENRSSVLGFGGTEGGKTKERASAALRELFRPEFLNRVDEVICFESLSREELGDIARLMLDELAANLKEKRITLRYTKGLVDYIVEHGHDERYGARSMRRVIQREVEARLAELYLSGELKDGDDVLALTLEGEISIKI